MPFQAPDARTELLMLVGDPVSHSRSPAMHNGAIARLGLPFVYVACRVERAHLRAAVDGMRALGVRGANVTVPHKEAVIALLDDVSETASRVGAVNTIIQDGDRLIGENTDVAGFLAPLEAMGRTPENVLILGAGGAARAAAYALREVSTIHLAARRTEQARRLISDLGIDGRAIELSEAPDAARDADLVVNATPIGGPGLEAATPMNWPDEDFSACLAYDLLYAPSPTRFLREAAARGAQTVDGMPMLRAQASAAFEMWTGHRFPDDLEI